jgi:hypothetical protein
METIQKKPTTAAAQPLREHISSDEHAFRTFRLTMVQHDRPMKAVTAATTGGFRVERSDLFIPFLDAMEKLQTEEERKAWRRAHPFEVKESEQALEHLARLDAQGFNGGTRAAEAAARAAEVKAQEERRAAAIAVEEKRLKRAVVEEAAADIARRAASNVDTVMRDEQERKRLEAQGIERGAGR